MNKTHRILILMSLALVTAGGLRSADTSTGTSTGTNSSTGTTTGGTTGSGATTGTTNTGTTNTGTTTGTKSGGTTATTTGGATTKKTPPGMEKRHTPNEHASDRAKAVQKLLKDFDASRETFMAERKALLAEFALATTTEARKKEILLQLKTDMTERHEEQRALRRDIGEQLKNLREQRKAGGGT